MIIEAKVRYVSRIPLVKMEFKHSMQTSESQFTNRISDFIVSDVGKATFGAGERVFHGKMCPTGTIGGDVGGPLTVPQSESISESPLAE